MNGTHFYLTLPSNSSKKFYGKQHPSNYKTKLDHVVSLDPELWEVGLAQISYPKSWPNLPNTSFYIGYPSPEFKPREQAHSVFSTKNFGGTRYLTPRHLVRDLQKDIRDLLPSAAEQAIKIKYDEVSNRAKFTLQKDYSLWMHDPLGKMLGLSSKVASRVQMMDVSNRRGYLLPELSTYYPENQEEISVVTPYTVHVDRIIPTIYVYCNLVQQQIVGDSYVQLVRTLSVPDTTSDMVTQKFTNIHYVNLQTGTFESVEIAMVDPLGKNIDFQHGDVITKLHFKRKTP